VGIEREKGRHGLLVEPASNNIPNESSQSQDELRFSEFPEFYADGTKFILA
jgi:hypothetical protein